MPEGPLNCARVPDAEETIGFGHDVSFKTCRYACSTSAGGGLSLAFSHISKLGCERRRKLWLLSDSRATANWSPFHLSHSSQRSQQHQPAMTRIPISSARLKNSSPSILPSSIIMFRFMSGIYYNYARMIYCY